MIETGRVITPNGLHLRTAPNDHSHVKATLPYGTVVDIDSHDGNWLKVIYGDKNGYLYKQYVAISNRPPPDIDLPHDPPPPAPSNFSLSGILIAVGLAFAAVVAWWFSWTGGN